MPPHPTSHHHLSTGSRGIFCCMRNFNAFIPKMLMWCDHLTSLTLPVLPHCRSCCPQPYTHNSPRAADNTRRWAASCWAFSPEHPSPSCSQQTQPQTAQLAPNSPASPLLVTCAAPWGPGRVSVRRPRWPTAGLCVLFGLGPLLPPKLFSEALAQHGCCFCTRSTDRSPGNRVDAGMASTTKSSYRGRPHSSTCEVSSMGSAAAQSFWGRSLHPRKAQRPRPRSREMARPRGVSHRAADH